MKMFNYNSNIDSLEGMVNLLAVQNSGEAPLKIKKIQASASFGMEVRIGAIVEAEGIDISNYARNTSIGTLAQSQARFMTDPAVKQDEVLPLKNIYLNEYDLKNIITADEKISLEAGSMLLVSVINKEKTAAINITIYYDEDVERQNTTSSTV